MGADGAKIGTALIQGSDPVVIEKGCKDGTYAAGSDLPQKSGRIE